MSDHAEAVGFGVCADDYRPSPSDEARLTRLRFMLVLEGQLDLRAVDQLATVTDVNVLLDDLATRRSRTDWRAVLIASAAASSQEVVLVPTTSITR